MSKLSTEATVNTAGDSSSHKLCIGCLCVSGKLGFVTAVKTLRKFQQHLPPNHVPIAVVEDLYETANSLFKVFISLPANVGCIPSRTVAVMELTKSRSNWCFQVHHQHQMILDHFSL